MNLSETYRRHKQDRSRLQLNPFSLLGVLPRLDLSRVSTQEQAGNDH